MLDRFELLPSCAGLDATVWTEPFVRTVLGGATLSPQVSPSRSGGLFDSPESGERFCTPCRKRFGNEFTFLAHEKSAKHQQALERERSRHSPVKVLSPTRNPATTPPRGHWEREAAVWESKLTATPNQALKGMFGVAHRLLQDGYIQAGDSWLHKILYHLQELAGCAEESWIACAPIGRAMMSCKVAMMLSRLFMSSGLGLGTLYDEALRYARFALRTFLSPALIRLLQQQGAAGTLSASLREMKEVWKSVKELVPPHFASKPDSSQQQQQQHDLYTPMREALVEIALLYSYFQVDAFSVSLLRVALAMIEDENERCVGPSAAS